MGKSANINFRMVAPAGKPAFRNITAARIGALVVGSLAFLSFLITYLSDGMRPGATYPLGWYGYWFDQSKYYDMIVSLPKGTMGEFSYPPLYPLLGALGRLVYPKDPFLLVDLTLFVAYIHLARRTFERFLSPALAIAAACVLITVSVDLFETPWTTTLSAVGMVLLLDLFTAGSYTFRTGCLAGLAGGLMFGARIGDVVPALAVGSYLFLDGRATKEAKGAFIRGLLLCGCAVAGLTIAINLKFDGRPLGNYFVGIMRQGFNWAAIPVKMYGYLIDPFVFHGESHPLSHPLMVRLPFLLLAPLGVWFLIRRPNAATARVGIPFALGIAGWSLLYVPFMAVTGLTLRQGSLHYLKPVLPILVGAAFFAIYRMVEPSTGADTGKAPKTLIYYALALGFCLFGVRMIPFPKLSLSASMLSSDFNPSQLAKMVDNDPATRWDSAALQRPGIEFNIDLQRPRLIQRIVLDTKASPNDYARKLTIWQSPDGKEWSSWWATDQSVDHYRNDFRSDPKAVRWLKFKLDDSDAHYYWSVHELSLYGW